VNCDARRGRISRTQIGSAGAGQPFGEALVRIDPNLLIPDFSLNEVTNVLWLQVRRKLFSPEEAREGLSLLRTQLEPTPTAHMRLHDVALDIGIAINHSTYNTL
jgi:predicted nucleic acid-binding protein